VATAETIAASQPALPAIAQIGNPAGMMPSIPMSEPGTPAPGHPNTQDRLFVYLMATGGMAEADSGALASQKASSDAVRRFARQMVSDHSNANQQLAGLVQHSGIPLPPQPAPEQRAMRAQLDGLSGAQFDLAYLRGQLVDHQKTAQILAWEIDQGQEAQLQRFAAATLPVVLQHMAMVQQILAEQTGAAAQGLGPFNASTARADL
jgi:putative membrane protein